MITTAQRAEVMRLMKKLEFDPKTITMMHRRVSVPEHLIGTSVDAWVGGMTEAEASALIDKMKGMI